MRNWNKIELTTMLDNKKAQGIYKTLGFEEIYILYDNRGYQDWMLKVLLLGSYCKRK